MTIPTFPYRRDVRPPFEEGLGEHTDREFEKIESAISNLNTAVLSGTGGVTSVDLAAPVGFIASGGPVTATGTLSFDFDAGYSLPLTADTSKGVSAFAWGNHATAGYLTSVSWGAITGTLASQTDLQTALDERANRVTTTVDNGLVRFDGITGSLQGIDTVTISDTGIQTSNYEATGGGQIWASFNDVSAGTRVQYFIRRARGTITAPTEVLTNDILGSFNFNGHSGTGTTYRSNVTMTATATEAGSTGAGGKWQLNIGNTGLTTQTTMLEATDTYVAATTLFRPKTNDGAALGSTTFQWSDIFLASGAVLNFANGNATLTHSTGLLTSNVPVVVPADAYGAGWNGSNKAATQDAVYDKIETLAKYIFGFFFTTAPTASEVLLLHTAGTAFTIPANFTSGLLANVGTNPTASFALTLQQNGVTIGTITVSTGGVVSATTVSGTAKSIAAGDLLKVIAPATPDATAANMAFTVIGTR